MLENRVTCENLVERIDCLLFYNSLQDDPVVAHLYNYVAAVVRKSEQEAVRQYQRFVANLASAAESMELVGNVFSQYILHFFLHDENPFTLACESGNINMSSSLCKLVTTDIETLRFLMKLDLSSVGPQLHHAKELGNYSPMKDTAEAKASKFAIEDNIDKLLHSLVAHYSNRGAGEFSGSPSFVYHDDGLVPVTSVFPVSFSDFVECNSVIKQVSSNMTAFLKGNFYNHMLISGDPGTGKSSIIRAISDTYFDEGLRIVNLTHDQMSSLPTLIHSLENRKHKFVIVVDNLDPIDLQTECRHINAALDACCRSRNVLLACIVNAGENEIEPNDGAGKLGLWVCMPALTVEAYLNVVTKMLEKLNVSLPNEFIKSQAIEWSQRKQSTSGRTARQFVDYVTAELKNR